jgi:gas vesicle protein
MVGIDEPRNENDPREGSDMGAGKRLVKFAGGGLLGAAVGTAVAILGAPQSGAELKGRITDRLRQARLAGAEAKASKEEELIRKFRTEVADPDALQEEESKVRLEASEAVAAIGLGLNAPGLLAAQETALRAADEPVPNSTSDAGAADPQPVAAGTIAASDTAR